MAWYDKAKQLVEKVMQGPTEMAGGQEPVAMMATGERRGFKPGVPHPEVEAPASSQVFPPVNAAQPEQGKKRRSFREWLFPADEEEQPAEGVAWQPMQQQPSQDSGFYQSMQSPVVNSSAFQGTGYVPGGYQQSAQSQPFVQSAYQQPAQSQPFAQSAYQQPAQSQPFAQSAYQQPAQNQPFAQSSYQAPVSSEQSQQNRRTRRGRTNQPAQDQRSDNVLYMNQNNFVDENGTAYNMVMRLAQPTSMAKCYRLIEFMRNGETVLVNLEQVRDLQENSRCLDLLYGAAYAMNCTYTKVAERCIYLISPRDVNVLSFTGLSQLNQRDNASRWPGSAQDPTVDQPWEPQRERQAAGGWSPSFGSATDPTNGRSYRANPVRYF